MSNMIQDDFPANRTKVLKAIKAMTPACFLDERWRPRNFCRKSSPLGSACSMPVGSRQNLLVECTHHSPIEQRGWLPVRIAAKHPIESLGEARCKPCCPPMETEPRAIHGNRETCERRDDLTLDELLRVMTTYPTGMPINAN